MPTLGNRPPWSAIFTGGIGVVAALSIAPAPFPSLALDTPLGRFLYLGTVTALVLAYVIAVMRENEKRDRVETHRDISNEQRHAADMAATAALKEITERELVKINSALTAIAAQTALGVSADSPQIQELVKTARVSAATIASHVQNPPDSPFTILGEPQQSAAIASARIMEAK
jgi:hypothetical protein